MIRFFSPFFSCIISLSTSCSIQGIDAEYVSLENIVPDFEGLDGEGEDETLDQSFYDNLALVLRDRMEQCGCRVPVVTGLFLNCLVL